MSNVSVHETANHIVIVIERAVSGTAMPVINQPTITTTPAPVVTPSPAGPGTQNWTAGEPTSERTEGDQNFLNDVLKGG